MTWWGSRQSCEIITNSGSAHLVAGGRLFQQKGFDILHATSNRSFLRKPFMLMRMNSRPNVDSPAMGRGSNNSMHLATGVNDAATRFAFGRNWQRFLRLLDEQRIASAEQSLRDMLEITTLQGLSFLDIGSGSGLFSLAAMRLGAQHVHSFDYDPLSVACACELKSRYFPSTGDWTIEQGSVLDSDYLSRLGQFDVVYSWGVLHHTGDMWRALANVVPLVSPGGKLFVAIYNDEGPRSHAWRWIKRIYNRWPILRPGIVLFFASYFLLKGLIGDTIVRRRNPLRRYGRQGSARGMAFWPDLIDWLGGYPFEFAKPGDIFDFYKRKNFTLLNLKAEGRGLGDNEYVFLKRGAD